MSQTKIILSVIVAVVALGGAYFFATQNKTSNKDVQNEITTNTKTPDVPEVSAKKMSFAEFMNQKGSYKCTVNQNIDDTQTQGVTYINDGMVRGEFNTKVQGFNIDTTFILRDGFTYTWTSMAPTMGFKMKVVENVEGDKNAASSGTYSFDAKQIGEYDCQPSPVDSSKFTLPSNIKFTDFSNK